jgi:DNA (cytosine-5)-methyltransferase 1
VGTDPPRSPAEVSCPYVKFREQLQALGYVVEDRVLDAADYGAPTHRRRLILVARCDGLPVAWPEATHGPGRAAPFRTAAECIDWAIAVPSIFDRKKPLAEATQRRIAEGLRRFVFENPKPFIVHTDGGMVAPVFVQTGQGERKGQTPRVRDVERPYPTAVAGGLKAGLVAAWLVKHYGGVTGHGVDRPASTVTARDHHSLAVCHLTKFYGTSTGASLEDPAPTVTASGGRGGGHAGLVAAFIVAYYGQGTGQALAGPLRTIVSKARFGLVTVEIEGEEWALVDIGLRMLSPRELARCQGFGDEFRLMGTQTEQTARIGNSVPPPLAAAVVRANVPRTVAEAA